MSTVKRAFRWLREHGYLTHDGVNNWKVYPSSNLPMGGTNEPLYIEVSLQKNITTTPTASAVPTTSQEIVVVIDEIDQDDLIYPKQLDTAQKKDAKRIIKKLKQPELSQPILLELAYIITTGKLKTTIPRCLGGLVSTANEQGYFIYSQTTKQAAGASISSKAHIDTQQTIKQQRQSKGSAPDVSRAYITGLKMAIRTA